MTVTESAVVVAWVVIVLLSIGFAAMVRQVAILTRIAESGFAASDQRGVNPIVGLRLPDRTRTLGWPDSNLLLLFVSPGCTTCGQLLADLSAQNDALPVDYRVLVVSRGHCPDSDGWPTSWTCVEKGSAEHDLFNVPGSPYAAIVDTSGVVVDAAFVREAGAIISQISSIDPSDNYQRSGQP